jgi:drug/metabolite transporter (DMT)-like permease
MFYWSMIFVVLGNVVYHVSQKSIPRGLDPVLSVTVSYVTALTLSAVLLPFSSARPLKDSLREVTWASFGVGAGAVVIEFAFLLVYRSGWNISLASFAGSAALAAILVPVGLLIYRERLSWVNVVGLLFCLLGFFLVTRPSS